MRSRELNMVGKADNSAEQARERERIQRVRERQRANKERPILNQNTDQQTDSNQTEDRFASRNLDFFVGPVSKRTLLVASATHKAPSAAE